MMPSLGGVVTMEAAQVAVGRWLPGDKVDKQSGKLKTGAACSRQPEMEAPLGLDLSG